VVGGAAGEQDRDDRDRRLGEGRADGCEHGADGPLPQPELVAEPFHRVREQLRPDQDQDERDREDPQVEELHAPIVPVTTPAAMTRSTRPETRAIPRSPPRAYPTSAAATRAAGVAMTTASPSHSAPAGCSDVRSATIRPGSSDGATSSGERPAASSSRLPSASRPTATSVPMLRTRAT